MCKSIVASMYWTADNYTDNYERLGFNFRPGQKYDSSF